MDHAQSWVSEQSKYAQRNLRFLRAIVWVITIGSGFLQAWAARFYVSPDGVCYLDIAGAYLRGDWTNAVNAYWSPFFSWLLSLCLGLFKPNPYWESTVLHLLNFAGLLVSLAFFEFFFRAFLRLQIHARNSEEPEVALSALGWWALGYALFLSTSLLVLTVINSTPDVWVAAWTYLLAGLLVRIRASGGRPHLFAALGFALACAYLTKTFYFPLSFVFLASAWLCAGNPRKTARLAILGFAVFMLVAGPWVAALSRAKHRFTFGDVGKLAFVNMIDNIPQPFFWQGEDQTGIPKHPVRQLLSKPLLFEFATPVSGTYPPTYDWSYWMEGARPHFSWAGQLRVLRQSAGTFFQIWTLQIEFGVALVALFYLAYPFLPLKRLLREQSYLWVPALIACASYAILLVELRYVAPFVLLLWVAAFSGLLRTLRGVPNRALAAVVLAAVSVTGLRIAKLSVSDLLTSLSRQRNEDWEVSEALHAVGIQPGDKVSSLSRGAEAHWARLAGVRIVSEIPLGNESVFWSAGPDEKRKVLNVFASTGAAAVVTRNAPIGAACEGWISLGNTAFYAYRLHTKPGGS